MIYLGDVLIDENEAPWPQAGASRQCKIILDCAP
jgi:hypothetical protein